MQKKSQWLGGKLAVGFSIVTHTNCNQNCNCKIRMKFYSLCNDLWFIILLDIFIESCQRPVILPSSTGKGHPFAFAAQAVSPSSQWLWAGNVGLPIRLGGLGIIWSLQRIYSYRVSVSITSPLANVIIDQLFNCNLQLSLKLAGEKGVSSWLSTLPLKCSSQGWCYNCSAIWLISSKSSL